MSNDVTSGIKIHGKIVKLNDIIIVQFPSNIGSETLQTDACPTTHPYAFSGGLECCKTQKEANSYSSVATCDGSALDLESNCCENGALIRCPAGDGKLCVDGNANGKFFENIYQL